MDEYDSYTLTHIKELCENVVVSNNDIMSIEKLVLLRDSQVVFCGNDI